MKAVSHGKCGRLKQCQRGIRKYLCREMEGVLNVIFVVIPKTSGKKRPDNFIYLFFSLQIY